jgi:hypothetical protein
MHYVLHIWGDVDPEVHGPFPTPEQRDEKALAIRRDDRGEDRGGIFQADVAIIDGEPVLEFNVYTGDFFASVDAEFCEAAA